MKRLLSMLLVLATVFVTTLSMPLAASAESLYIRKIVSVVYDDSGSMAGDKWAYANYAMQAFCGMLNSEDQLFITYMSYSKDNDDYDPEEIDLSAGGIQDSVNSIRNHDNMGYTPYDAVEIAFDKLKSVDDSNPNTQYWLVVITDGVFDECKTLSDAEGQRFVDEGIGSCADEVMPNGSNPQVTFLSIGSDVISPKQDQNKGIYVYTADNASEITGTMSEMADRISGRTRLSESDMEQVDEKTIRVSSSIPLLNIAVFAQESDAQITKVVYGNEMEIPICRQAELSYPGYSDLVGGACLLGDSQNVIGSGIYDLTFDQEVDLNDVVVLFEPALEMRMTVTVNGEEISDYKELDDTSEGDELSISCKIYEMGTETEIDPQLMPPGTKFEISVSENGEIVEQSSGEQMILSDYVLKQIETEVTASVIIEGFNPIDYSAKFTPTEYVPPVVYTLDSQFESDVKSVKFDDIASNTDLSISFTVYADGVALIDPDAVKALNPTINVSPEGNDGNVTYSDDGRIIFTPNCASMSTADSGSFDVDVTCTLDNGESAAETYTVLLSSYQVVPIDTDESIKKTEFYENDVSVSFYVTKDGVKLGKEDVEGHISVVLNEAHSDLKTNVTIAADGTITVTPYSEEKYELTFWNWWKNWWVYFGLEGEDVTVTLDHDFGTADSVIDVTGASLSHQLLYVYVPLALELVALLLFITWIVLIFTKPKYCNNAMLYVGEIKYNKGDYSHTIRDFRCIRLEKFNRIKKGNGRLKFNKTADIVSAKGVMIRADHGGRIICEMPCTWYKGTIEPCEEAETLKTPAEISKHFNRHKRLKINEFAVTETVDGKHDKGLLPANSQMARYIVIPASDNGVGIEDDHRVIRQGKIFIYIK